MTLEKEVLSPHTFLEFYLKPQISSLPRILCARNYFPSTKRYADPQKLSVIFIPIPGLSQNKLSDGQLKSHYFKYSEHSSRPFSGSLEGYVDSEIIWDWVGSSYFTCLHCPDCYSQLLLPIIMQSMPGAWKVTYLNWNDFLNGILLAHGDIWRLLLGADLVVGGLDISADFL